MSSKMQIGLYMFAPMLGGAEQYFKDLIWNLDRSRYEVTVFYEPWPPFEEFLDLRHCPEVRVCPIQIVEPGGHHTDSRYPRLPQAMLRRLERLLIRYVFALPNLLRLFQSFRQYPVGILHINNGGYPGAQSACLAAVAAKLAGCRHTIMTIASTPIPPSSSPLECLLDYGVARSLDRIVVLSDRLGRPILQRCGFTLAQCVTIPYGIVDPIELLGARQDREVSQKSEEARTGPVIGMFANFMPYKGHRYLVQAVARLQPSFPDLRVLLVGGGPSREPIEKLVTGLNLGDRVLFTGPCSHLDLLTRMREIDIFVLPSEVEGMPYVVLEAMSLAKPVVASDIGGISDEVLNGQTGLLVPARDATALAQALEQGLRNPGLAQAMGEAGRARYEANFTLRLMIDRYMALYDQLAAANATP